jgi:hypothetical protein
MVLAFPGPTKATTEIVGRNAFLDGLNDGSLVLRIREREPNTMEEALRIAVRFEAYKKVDETDANHGVKSLFRQVRGSYTEPDVAANPACTSSIDNLMSKIDRLTQIVTQNISGKPSITIVYGTARPVESLPVNSTDYGHAECRKSRRSRHIRLNCAGLSQSIKKFR